MDTKGTGCALTVPKYKFYRKTVAQIDKFLCAKLPSSITEILENSRSFLDSDVSNNGNSDLHCYCQDKEYGKMIMYENGCQYVWFHYDCVGIRRATEENVVTGEDRSVVAKFDKNLSTDIDTNDWYAIEKRL